jgi:hypothetical protein
MADRATLHRFATADAAAAVIASYDAATADATARRESGRPGSRPGDAFRCEANARDIANANTKAALQDAPADRWTYTAVARGRFYVVEVRDETGVLVGCI